MERDNISWSGSDADFKNPLVKKYWELSDELDQLEWDIEMNTNPVVLESNIVMENPYIIDQKGANWRVGNYAATINEAILKGHDGIILKNTNDPVKGENQGLYDQYVVFDDSQVGVKQYYVMEDDYQEVQKFEEDKAKLPADSPWTLYQLEKVESVVTVRDNAPQEVRVYEISMQPEEMYKLFGEDKPASLELDDFDKAREINSNPTRIDDWQQIYKRALEAKGKDGKP